MRNKRFFIYGEFAVIRNQL